MSEALKMADFMRSLPAGAKENVLTSDGSGGIGRFSMESLDAMISIGAVGKTAVAVRNDERANWIAWIGKGADRWTTLNLPSDAEYLIVTGMASDTNERMRFYSRITVNRPYDITTRPILLKIEGREWIWGPEATGT